MSARWNLQFKDSVIDVIDTNLLITFYWLLNTDHVTSYTRTIRPLNVNKPSNNKCRRAETDM